MQLARVLYGETETNFVDLLKGVTDGISSDTSMLKITVTPVADGFTDADEMPVSPTICAAVTVSPRADLEAMA